MYKLIVLFLITISLSLFADNGFYCSTSMGSYDEVEKMTIGELYEDTMTRDLTVEPEGQMFLEACYEDMQNTLVCEFNYGFLGRNYRMEIDLEKIQYDDSYYLQGTIKKSFAKQSTVICRPY
jgi:hypothetical protein